MIEVSRPFRSPSGDVISGMRKSRGQWCFEQPKRSLKFKFSVGPVPVTASYEDDMVKIARSESGADRWNERYKLYERARFLHSFAIYRWYRAVLRWFKNPPKEPAIFGDLQAQGRRYEQQH